MGLFTLGKAAAKYADNLFDDVAVQAKKQSTEAGWDEAAWVAENPPPDFGGVRVKDLNDEQRRRWKAWHTRKSTAKHKSARKARNQKYYSENQDQIKEQQAGYRDRTRDGRNAARRERYENDPEYRQSRLDAAKKQYDSLPDDVKRAKRERAKQQLNDRIAAMSPEELAEYKAKMAVSASERRARILQRTPAWANKDEISEIYQIAQEVSQLTGVPHDVDHIIPLLGYSGQRSNRVVDGLHHQDNLLVVPKVDNLSKGAGFDLGSRPEQGGVEAARGLLYGTMDELGLIK